MVRFRGPVGNQREKMFTEMMSIVLRRRFTSYPLEPVRTEKWSIEEKARELMKSWLEKEHFQ
jgi:hypothetical protein